jgi:hypothetical protein
LHKYGIKMRLLKVCLLLFVILLTSTLTACDTIIQMKGTTYEWINATIEDKGQIYVDEAMPNGMSLKPVSNIVVWCGYQGMRATESPKRFHPPSTTDISGNFSGSWVAGGGSRLFTLRVDEELYYPLVKDFFHKGHANGTHFVNIILVRKTR